MTPSRERLGFLFVLVGPGGVGKNTLMRRVLDHNPHLSQLPTATTRPMRPGEQHGRERWFLSLDEFHRLIEEKALVEYQEVRPGQLYGVPRSAVDSAIREQRDLIADIEVYGAVILREQYPESAVLVFIAPPTMQALEDHMRERGTDEATIRDRMKRAQMEMTYAPICDYFIVNDEIDTASDELRAIVESLQQGTERPATGHKVSYSISVTLMCDGQVLRSGADQALPTMPIHGRELPQTVVQQFVSSLLPAPSNDQFPLVDILAAVDTPVEIRYDTVQRAYHITYHYVFPLNNQYLPPAGYRWMPQP